MRKITNKSFRARCTLTLELEIEKWIAALISVMLLIRFGYLSIFKLLLREAAKYIEIFSQTTLFPKKFGNLNVWKEKYALITIVNFLANHEVGLFLCYALIGLV